MRTMTEIENPRHSRPIDMHRWSDHPEVKALVEDIWDVWLHEEITGKPGVKRTGDIDACGPERPSADSQLCCGAARHSCRSLQERNHMMGELKEPTRTAHSRHLPLKKGHVVTMTHDYMRHGTAGQILTKSAPIKILDLYSYA